VALTREPENVGGTHDISFEAPFIFRLAGHIDMLVSGVFVCNLWFLLVVRVKGCFLPSHSLACGNFSLVKIHCNVYIINSLLAANSMCSWVSYLFDCKPRLIKFFLHQFMRLTFFYFFTLSKGIAGAQSFLGYDLSNKLFFCIRFSSASRAHPSQEGLW